MSFASNLHERNSIPWTFKSWISNFKGVDLPIGDLAEDILADDDFPEYDSFTDIYDHIRGRRGNTPALDTFVTVWNFYLASNTEPDSLLK